MVSSGLKTKGHYACPWCMEQLDARWSTTFKKMIYGHYRRELPSDHPFRTSLKMYFDNTVERRKEEEDVSDDALEDEDEREIGEALTLSRNEIEDLMWDEREDSDDEKVQKTRYVPNVHCGLMVFKNQLSILFVNLNRFLVALAQALGYILLSNDMVRCKM
jgi:hypothetical protein